MSEDVTLAEIRDELRAAILAGVKRRAMSPEQQADAVMETVVKAMTGIRVRFPSTTALSAGTIQAIREAWEAGHHYRAIMKNLGVSRGSVYKFRPATLKTEPKSRGDE